MRYKESAIKQFAENVRDFLLTPGMNKILRTFGPAVISPIPTSRPRSHPDHDDRLERLCSLVAAEVENVSYLNVFDVTEVLTPAHEGGRRDVDYLKSKIIYQNVPSECKLLILVDDVLTKGSHYIACRDIAWLGNDSMPIIGLFLSIHRSDYVDYESLGINI